MTKFNSKIDIYINQSEHFAKPILKRIRSLVHTACPEVEEKIKWSFPHFDYHDKMLCHMAAFKHHCTFGFWLSNQMNDPDHILQKEDEKSAMGSLGKIQSLQDLPSEKTILKYIHQAMQLSDSGKKLERRKEVKKELEVPNDFFKALSSNNTAKANFESLPISHRNEYIQWISEAKLESTKKRRLEKAIQQIQEGKKINWKYESKV